MAEENKKVCISEEVDRLSDLPDHILCHILSFLETQYVIRTSLLSRKWRNFRTTVPTLKLNSHSFLRLTDFRKFVCKVLDERDLNSSVAAFCFHHHGRLDDCLRKRVINYALSHNVQNLFIQAGMSTNDFIPRALFELQTLKTQHPGSFELTKSVGFTTLTTLHLECLSFSDAFGDCCDLLECFPNLKGLCLYLCGFSRFKTLKISGPKLLNLTMAGILCYDPSTRLHENCKVEISTPNLMYFYYKSSGKLVNFSAIYLPCLQHAHIDVSSSHRTNTNNKEEYKENLLKLFQCLDNVQFSSLSVYTIQALDEVPGMEHQPPSLSRLKSMKITSLYKFSRPFSVPAKVANYFLKGSPCAEARLEDFPVERNWSVVAVEISGVGLFDGVVGFHLSFVFQRICSISLWKSR